ncbi:MAG TPA: discoidin domain-containing protein [Patescibacteria group bacterium]|nr:discoidin domain-containing protein [Patescibacteria group bacterium]
MIKRKQVFLYFLSVILVVVSIVYLPFVNGFFQQDEWNLFGVFTVFRGLGQNFFLQDFIKGSGLHFVPLANIFSYLEFSLLKLNFVEYAFTSIFFHVLATALVFAFVSLLINNKRFGLLSALFFGISNAGNQATTWVVANVSVQGAVIFSVLSLIFFIKFAKSANKISYYISYFLLVISLLFKENAIAFFVFLPITFYLYANKDLRKKYFYPLFIFVTGVFYGLIKVFMILHASVSGTAGSQSKLAILYNLITFPLKGLVQTIIPVDLELSVAKSIALIFPEKVRGFFATTQFDIFVQKRVLEMLTFVFFLIIVFICFFIYKKIEDKNIKKGIIFAFIFVLINSFIYALSPDRVGIIPIVDSRNLYFLTIGSSILISICIYFVYLYNTKVAFLISFLFLVLNIFYLNKNIRNVTMDGVLRKNILDTIKKDYPILPEKTIVFTQSDSSFYGLPENTKIMPFQSGFGQTLLVWYQEEENFPKEFFENNFLWNIDSEGYMESNGKGFGYFRNFGDMMNYISTSNLDKNNVIAFDFNSSNDVLTDITQEMRGRIEGFEAKKRILNPNQIKIFSSSNKDGLNKILDRNEKTFWDSKLPYSNYQYLLLSFNKPHAVARLTIDSYNNVNQLNVGYRIEISNDNKNWQEVFENRSDGSENGKVDIYFKPISAKYIKIEQIGNDNYTDWVINELTVYEKY